MKPYKYLFLLHLIVFIYGFTAILGKLITLPAIDLVWWRVLIALSGISIYLFIRQISIKVGEKELFYYIFLGLIIAIHWIFFYEAIKVSNVSVTLVCYSSGALFASLLEPVFYKRKIIWYEFFFGMLVMAGVYLIFKVETKYTTGILYSLLAAFLSALFAVLNGPLVKKQNVKLISFYEMVGALFTMLIFLLFAGKVHLSFTSQIFSISVSDWIYLLILGLICTSFAYTAGLEVMKGVSPYTLILTVNLEPVYGIILAFFIFGEEEKMSLGFYLGALIIFTTIFADALLKRKRK